MKHVKEKAKHLKIQTCQKETNKQTNQFQLAFRLGFKLSFALCSSPLQPENSS